MQNIVALVLGSIVIAGLFAVLCGFPIMWLWNALMPDLFHLPTISFLQALGLGLLGRLLFGAGSSSSSSSKR